MVYETASVQKQKEAISEVQEMCERLGADGVHKSLRGVLMVMERETNGKFDYTIIDENEIVVEGHKITPAFKGRSVIVDGEESKGMKAAQKIAKKSGEGE